LKKVQFSLPLLILVLATVSLTSGFLVYAATFYTTKLSAIGSLEFTNEVSITGIDLLNSTTVVVLCSKTEQTQLGKTYTVTAAVDSAVGIETVSWQTGDPQQKIVYVNLNMMSLTTFNQIRVKIGA